MSLIGNLEDLSLPDILQIVNLSRRTGLLSIQSRDKNRHHIQFKNGSIVNCISDRPDPDLLRFMEVRGLLTADECTQLRTQAVTGPQGRGFLGAALDLGLLNDILAGQIKREYVSLRVKQLARLTTGDFTFHLQDMIESGEVKIPWSETLLEEAINPHSLRYDHLDWDEPGSPAATAASAAPEPAGPVDVQFDVTEEPAPSAAHGARPVQVPVDKPRVVDAGTFIPPEADLLGGEAPLAPPAAPTVHEPEVIPPVARSAQPAPEARAEPAAVRQRGTVLLLLDDEDLYRNILRVKLEELGETVEAVATVSEGLERAARLRKMGVDVIPVVDLVLPTRDRSGFLGGQEFLRELSGTGQGATPSIMLLEAPEKTMRTELEQLGVRHWIPKPSLESMQLQQMDGVLSSMAEQLAKAAATLKPREDEDEEASEFFRDLGVEQAGQSFKVRDQLSLLKGLMGELQNPSESAEISLLVLRLAAEYLDRGVLFLVKKDELTGLGGFGDTGTGKPMTQQMRKVNFNVPEGSRLAQVLQSGQGYTGPTGTDERDLRLVSALGSHQPEAITLIPMSSRGRVIAVLYGDNAVSGRALGDLQGLEIFMSQAGISMENALLQRQLATLRRGLKPNA